jgi:hypothetical protein
MRFDGDEKMNFNDTLFVTAILVFTMMVVGLVLTVKEFSDEKKNKDKDS